MISGVVLVLAAVSSHPLFFQVGTDFSHIALLVLFGGTRLDSEAFHHLEMRSRSPRLVTASNRGRFRESIVPPCLNFDRLGYLHAFI
jgi:hypothetical protein